jgi:protein-L-isoaspartate(D-aspartate) O-methyltransferase
MLLLCHPVFSNIFHEYSVFYFWSLPPSVPLLGLNTTPEIWAHERQKMVQDHLQARNITNPSILHAFATVPREKFVPFSDWLPLAYADQPLLLPHDQRLSQPYVIAYMLQELQLKPTDTVLEVGTGSGYQAALLSLLARRVYSIEIFPDLAYEAETRISQMKIKNVFIRSGDGAEGWLEHSPYQAIILTFAVEEIPLKLLSQLAPEGRLITPFGPFPHQQLRLVTRSLQGDTIRDFQPVMFKSIIRPTPTPPSPAPPLPALPKAGIE